MLKKMYRLFFIILLIKNVFVLTIAKCPKGMISSMSDKTTCFLFVSTKQPFFIAENFCNQKLGHLASLHDAFDNNLIREEAQQNFTDSTSSRFWIGANDLKKSGIWSWIDGTSFDFTDWMKGQPNGTPEYHCGSVQLHEGLWTSDNCDDTKPFVCTIKVSSSLTTIKPKTCPNFWAYNSKTDPCYFVSNSTKNWGDAENWCFSQNAHLVSIHSLDENNFVTNLIPFDPNNHGCGPSQYVYIGLYTVTKEANWRWIDDSAFDFSAWAPKRPAYPTKSFCGIIWNGPPCNAPFGTWADDNCDSENKYFVCKKSLN